MHSFHIHLNPLRKAHTISHPAHILLSLLGPCQPLKFFPPSNSITFPVKCALALLLKYNTVPAKSLGLPTRPVGWPLMIVSANFPSPNAVMREGKMPGQMTFAVMCLVTSLLACILVRWMQAALLGPSVFGQLLSFLPHIAYSCMFPSHLHEYVPVPGGANPPSSPAVTSVV